MGIQRRISWSAAISDFKADRAVRAEIREERLRTTAGLRGTPALVLSAWRGRSGRRYVVGIHPVDATDLGDAVVMAVARDADGVARLLAFGRVSAGATELHVHRLAETPAARAAVVADLTA